MGARRGVVRAAGGNGGVDRSGVEARDVKLRLTSVLYDQLVDLASDNGYRKPQALLRDLVRLVGLLGMSEHIRDVLSGTPGPKTCGMYGKAAVRLQRRTGAPSAPAGQLCIDCPAILARRDSNALPPY